MSTERPITSESNFSEVVQPKRPQKREESRSLIKLATEKLKVVSGKREGAGIKSSCPVKSIFVYQLDPVVTGEEIKDLLMNGNVLYEVSDASIKLAGFMDHSKWT